MAILALTGLAIWAIVEVTMPLGSPWSYIAAVVFGLAAHTQIQLALAVPRIRVSKIPPKVCAGCHRIEAPFRTPFSRLCIDCKNRRDGKGS